MRELKKSDLDFINAFYEREGDIEILGVDTENGICLVAVPVFDGQEDIDDPHKEIVIPLKYTFNGEDIEFGFVPDMLVDELFNIIVAVEDTIILSAMNLDILKKRTESGVNVKYRLTDEGIRKCKEFLDLYQKQRLKIINSGTDTASDTQIPTIEEIETDLPLFGSKSYRYMRDWQITDHFKMYESLVLEYKIDFVEK